MSKTGDKTILQRIGEMIATAPSNTKAVLLPPDQWSALCDETGVDRDSVLMQHKVPRDGADHKVLIMPRGPIA